MKRREDIYNLGNDYFQKADVYFVTDDAEAAKSAKIDGYKAYSDGLYHYTTQPAYELSGGVSALNKRIFNVLPQSTWAPAQWPRSICLVCNQRHFRRLEPRLCNRYRCRRCRSRKRMEEARSLIIDRL